MTEYLIDLINNHTLNFVLTFKNECSSIELDLLTMCTAYYGQCKLSKCN